MKIELQFDLVNLLLVPISGNYFILTIYDFKNQIFPYLLFFNIVVR